jgi:hypothetical protein
VAMLSLPTRAETGRGAISPSTRYPHLSSLCVCRSKPSHRAMGRVGCSLAASVGDVTSSCDEALGGTCEEGWLAGVIKSLEVRERLLVVRERLLEVCKRSLEACERSVEVRERLVEVRGRSWKMSWSCT